MRLHVIEPAPILLLVGSPKQAPAPPAITAFLADTYRARELDLCVLTTHMAGAHLLFPSPVCRNWATRTTYERTEAFERMVQDLSKVFPGTAIPYAVGALFPTTVYLEGASRIPMGDPLQIPRFGAEATTMSGFCEATLYRITGPTQGWFGLLPHAEHGSPYDFDTLEYLRTVSGASESILLQRTVGRWQASIYWAATAAT